MKIGIIGAGSVAQTIGKAWKKAGHSIMLSSRNPGDLSGLAEQLGITIGTSAESAQFGDVVLLAVNYQTINQAFDAIRPYVDDKLVIDATNPLKWAEDGGTERVLHDDEISGEVSQFALPDARVGKAFTTLWTGYLEEHGHAEPRIAMTLAADNVKDRNLIAALIADVGFEPVDLGVLGDSRPLDPPSPIWNVVLTASELRERVQAFRHQHSKPKETPVNA